MFYLKQCRPLALSGHDHCIQLSPRLFELPLEFLDDRSLPLDESLVPLYLCTLDVIYNVHLREFGLSRLDFSSDPGYLILPRPNVSLHLPQLVPRQLLHLLTRHLGEVSLTSQMLQLSSQLSALVLL